MKRLTLNEAKKILKYRRIKPDSKLLRQIERVLKLPTKGYYTFLHHHSPVEWSENLHERLLFVLDNKPRNELFDRLWCIRFLGTKVRPSYAEGVKKIPNRKRFIASSHYPHLKVTNY